MAGRILLAWAMAATACAGPTKLGWKEWRASHCGEGPDSYARVSVADTGICEKVLLRDVFRVHYDFTQREVANRDVVDWFCTTTDNSSAFNFAQAAKAVLPVDGFPVPVEGSGSASYSKQKREDACKYLQTHDSRSLYTKIVAKTTDNRAALESFDACVKRMTEASAAAGSIAAVPFVADMSSAKSSVAIALQWTPSSEPKKQPHLCAVLTAPGVECATRAKGSIPVAMRGNTVLACQRTTCEPSTAVLGVSNYGDVKVEIPACVVAAPTSKTLCPGGGDILVDNNNCGSCGTTCGPGGMCVDGFCRKCSASVVTTNATTGGEIASLSCRMRPGIPVTVSIAGTKSPYQAFPICSIGGCDINTYFVRTEWSVLGKPVNVPEKNGNPWDPLTFSQSFDGWVPSDGLVTSKFLLRECHYVKMNTSCDLSFVKLSVEAK